MEGSPPDFKEFDVRHRIAEGQPQVEALTPQNRCVPRI